MSSGLTINTSTLNKERKVFLCFFKLLQLHTEKNTKTKLEKGEILLDYKIRILEMLQLQTPFLPWIARHFREVLI